MDSIRELIKLQALAITLSFLPPHLREKIAERIAVKLVTELKLATVDELEEWMKKPENIKHEYVVFKPVRKD